MKKNQNQKPSSSEETVQAKSVEAVREARCDRRGDPDSALRRDVDVEQTNMATCTTTTSQTRDLGIIVNSLSPTAHVMGIISN